MAKELSGQSATQDINRAKNQGNLAHTEGTTDKTLRDGLTALFSAQVYFECSRSLMPRLLGTDNRELGSLFSPYWQARLVETPCLTWQEIAVSYGTVAPCLQFIRVDND